MLLLLIMIKSAFVRLTVVVFVVTGVVVVVNIAVVAVATSV